MSIVSFSQLINMDMREKKLAATNGNGNANGTKCLDFMLVRSSTQKAYSKTKNIIRHLNWIVRFNKDAKKTHLEGFPYFCRTSMKINMLRLLRLSIFCLTFFLLVLLKKQKYWAHYLEDLHEISLSIFHVIYSTSRKCCCRFIEINYEYLTAISLAKPSAMNRSSNKSFQITFDIRRMNQHFKRFDLNCLRLVPMLNFPLPSDVAFRATWRCDACDNGTVGV